jgi:hypothetical protein
MSAPPDARVRGAPAPESASFAGVRDFLARVGRRRRLIAAAEGASAGMLLAAVTAAATWRAGGPLGGAITVGIALIIAGIAARMVGSSMERPRLAELVERQARDCRNIIVTAAESADRPPGTLRRDIEIRLFRDADRAIARLDPGRLFPARRAALAFAGGATIWALALAPVAARSGRPADLVEVAADAVAIAAIEIVVIPQSYARRPRQMLHDPARIEALAGSTVALTVRAIAESVTVETIGGRAPLVRAGGQMFTGQVIADGDGYLAIEATASDGQPAARRLIGLTVTADRLPRVRLTAPGRDLFLPDAARTLDLTVEADDDLGLASLRLRFTKVSGSGEQFTFTEGEVPLRIVRTSHLMWRGHGELPLPTLALQPGDVVVYRGVSADRRPGAPAVESDAFLVEITSPGAVASEGFAMDDEDDRYAVSQQMVILKTERLLTRRRAMTAQALAEESHAIAAEQRRVRAEFVFMMGGELAEQLTGAETGISELHEEAEAEAGDDILAGRLANRGRVELTRAIRSMSQAASALVAVNLDRALQDERLALEHLQRAFSRTRYILRALTERERLDLSRRLTGTLTDAGRHVRPVSDVTSDSTIAAQRGALARIAELVAAERLTADAALAASTIAQRVLRIDPSSETLQGIAARLGQAAVAITDRRSDEARSLLDQAAIELTGAVRARLVNAPRDAGATDIDRLDGALVDALRRGGAPR